MTSRLLRRSLSALALLAASAGCALAEEVEGVVTRVGAQGEVDIRLPVGTEVAPGDKVTILAEIPGLGLTAITTLWQVDGETEHVITARPLDEPSGMPQIGYVARIETRSTAATALDPDPRPVDPMAGQNLAEGHSVPPPEAGGALPASEALYRGAAALLASGDRDQIAAGIALLRDAAALEHPRAMSDLGAALMFGHGVAPDVNEAMALHWAAMQLGDARAMVRLGLIHGSGVGAFDPTQELGWLQSAAEKGDADAMFFVAMIHEDGTAFAPASMPDMVRWLEKAAAKGHLGALTVLGQIYIDGEDGVIPKDIALAERYWTEAAERGYVFAMDELAAFYEGRDTEAAAYWVAEARAAPPVEQWQDDPRCFNAWECYIPALLADAVAQSAPAPTPAPATPAQTPGPTTPGAQQPAPASQPRETREMQACDRLAANNNDPDLPDPGWAVPYDQVDGARAIDACLADIERWPDERRFHTQLATAYHRAGRYTDALREARVSADMGSGHAMGMVAIMYKNGSGVEQNAATAIQWFEKGAAAGNFTAMHFAAHMYLDGDGVPFDAPRAAELFRAAADIGSAEAMAQLGILYDNGQGVPYDPDRSAANLLAGLALGSATAQDVLIQNPGRLSPHTRTAVQRELQDDGLYTGALDGSFGPNTLQALRDKTGN